MYSNLVDVIVKSPNHSGNRTHCIDRITPHCIVGQLSAESIGHCFPKGRKASCNYGIGTDGRVCLVVDEEKRSWCTSSNTNDQRAVTIECASDKVNPYTMNQKVYKKLIELCVDICKRYGKNKLIWISDKKQALSYKQKDNEMLLTVHRWYANKSCPGDWLFNRLDEVAKKVTFLLNEQKNTSFYIKVLVPELSYREGPGVEYKKKGSIKDKGVYTIVETRKAKDGGTWGKLLSGAGWINIGSKYCERRQDE